MSDSRFDEKRPFKYLYNSVRWRDLRSLVLRRHPVCVECKRAPSTVVDHIQDHRGDLKLFYDPTNLRGLCAPCHNMKTGSQHGGNRKPARKRIGLDEAGRVIDAMHPKHQKRQPVV